MKFLIRLAVAADIINPTVTWSYRRHLHAPTLRLRLPFDKAARLVIAGAGKINAWWL